MSTALAFSVRHLGVLAVALTTGLFSADANAFFNQSNRCVESVQTGLSVVPLGGGLYRWETKLDVTNNGLVTLQDLHLVTQRACQASVQQQALDCIVAPPDVSDPARMSWNDGTMRWDPRAAGVVYADPDNPAFFLSLTADTTKLSPTPEFGVDPGDAIPAFAVGNLGPGQTVPISVDYVLNSNSTSFYFNGAFVSESPGCTDQVPAIDAAGAVTLALILGLSGFALLARRRMRTVADW